MVQRNRFRGRHQAVEMKDRGFVVAVQWHPEETLHDLRLFRALVDAAAEYVTGRVAG